MKIFYTASYYGKEKYQKYYDMVLKVIEATKAELIATEKGNYKQILSDKEIKQLKKPLLIHYEAIKKGILWADAVIIEISNEDFQLGHEATLTIQNKKPVLCLSIHEDFSKKINNRFFFGARYNEYNVEEIVENFINFVKKEQLSERFNLFITPSQLSYVEKKAKEEKVNKSEYIRKLIDEDRKK